MPVRVIGLDVSTGSSGLTMPDGSCRTIRSRTGAGDNGRRLHEIKLRIDPYLQAAKPEIALIEDYFVGYKVSKQTCLRLGEIGGVVRDRLFEMGVPYVDVGQSQVKLFATGSGGASKDEVMEAAVQSGAVVANNDESDSWWLYAIGRAQFSETWEPAYRSVELLEVRREVREGLRWPALEGVA